MRVLIIYDASIKLDSLSWPSLQRDDEVWLFPLTTAAATIDRFRGLVGKQGVSVNILESARFINESAQNLRQPYLDFIANIALDVRHDGKNLREFFAIDDVASMWWLSLVAEKNTFKSDAFNRLAQCDAIIDVIRRSKIQSVFIAVKSLKLRNTIKEFSVKEEIPCTFWPTKRSPSKRKELKEFQGMHFVKHFAHMLVCAASFFLKSRKIRKALSSYRRTLNDPDQLMLVSAFPYLDASLAKKGIFRNRLYAHLQQSLEEQKQKILWAVFYVQNETVSFDEALQFARQFIEKGQNIYFLEESCTVGMQLKTLGKLLLQSIKFMTIEKFIIKRHQWKGYNFYSVLKDDWYRSFSGPEGYQSLIFYTMFQDLLGRAQARKGLYCCEMQFWEKALLLAKKKTQNPMPILAYQHTTVSRLLLNYFSTPMEMHSNGQYSFIGPDTLICNGPITFEYLNEAGWKKDKLVVGEAIRFMDLNKKIDHLSHKKQVVLIAFSINPEESAAILRVVYEAFKDKNIEVWIKSHPFMAIDQVFSMAGIKRENCPFQIRIEPIEELLRETKVIVVGESSVCLNALAQDCDVILVNVPDWINMSPLGNIQSGKIKRVFSSAELFTQAQESLSSLQQDHTAEVSEVINRFFYFNKDSVDPRRLLDLLKER